MGLTISWELALPTMTKHTQDELGRKGQDTPLGGDANTNDGLGGLPSSVSPRGVVNRVSFTLPSLPASVNKLYIPGYSISRSTPTWDIAPEWKLWRSSMMPRVPRFSIKENSIVRVDRCYHFPWKYKNGNWRKMDVANMDNLLFNLIKIKIDVDDMFFKCGWMDSRNSDAKCVFVTLTEIPEKEWLTWGGRLNQSTE